MAGESACSKQLGFSRRPVWFPALLLSACCWETCKHLPSDLWHWYKLPDPLSPVMQGLLGSLGNITLPVWKHSLAVFYPWAAKKSRKSSHVLPSSFLFLRCRVFYLVYQKFGETVISVELLLRAQKKKKKKLCEGDFPPQYYFLIFHGNLILSCILRGIYWVLFASVLFRLFLSYCNPKSFFQRKKLSKNDSRVLKN